MVVWQFAHCSPLAIWFGLLPVAAMPLWQFTQLPLTPRCGLTGTPAAAVATGAVAEAVAGVAAAADGAAVAVDAASTDTLAAALAVAGAGRACAPPPQLLVLWQPLQSLLSLLPELWSLGRVCRFVTP
jgi:hypothetical protein